METLVNAISSGSILGIFLKLFGVVTGFLYLFFALVVLRQVGIMKSVITENDGGLLRIMASIQVVLAVAIVIFALFM